MTLIDTHIALWLYAGLTERLPKPARALIEERAPRISPLVSLELAYLHEVGKARDSAPAMVAALRQSIGLEVADVSFADLVDRAIDLSWTRDPFDRMIAAHAIVADAPLVTADKTIREHLPQAIWD